MRGQLRNYLVIVLFKLEHLVLWAQRLRVVDADF